LEEEAENNKKAALEKVLYCYSQIYFNSQCYSTGQKSRSTRRTTSQVPNPTAPIPNKCRPSKRKRYIFGGWAGQRGQWRRREEGYRCWWCWGESHCCFRWRERTLARECALLEHSGRANVIIQTYNATCSWKHWMNSCPSQTNLIVLRLLL
jgi:hypothetical protein